MFARIALISLMVATVGVFFWFDLWHYLSLDVLQEKRALCEQFYKENPWTAMLGVAALYTTLAAFSLPGAAIITLAAGAIFGFTAGVIIVSFASSIGATLAFLISHFLLRDLLKARYRDTFKTMDEGVKKDGYYYLLTLRLVPLVPFFLVNIVMGLTAFRALPFYLISQIGMLPGTMAYVFAGTQLSTITSLNDIVSAPLIAAFTIVGLLPLFATKGVEYVQHRRIFKPFSIPKRFDYNLVVIGAGAGGLVSAYIASAVKAKVALIEKEAMGGDCLNTGCVPSKALLRCASACHEIRQANELGIETTSPTVNFQEVMQHVQQSIKTIEPNDSVERYTKLGVDCIQGHATMIDPFRVKIDDREITTRSIIIASGASPVIPAIAGLDEVPYVTSNTIWSLKELPKRLVVMGGGPIGCELAQAFSRLGSEVSIVEMAPSLMTREDEDVSTYVQERFEKEGISLYLNHKAMACSTEQGTHILHCQHGEDETIPLPFDTLLIALGRKANTKGFGMEELGISLTPHHTIDTDPFLRTNYPNIYVCGDATGPYQFTHMAAHQAWYACVNALFAPFKKWKVDYRVVPWATFTDPEVARVGLNEKEATEKSIPYEVTTYPLSHLDRAITDHAAYGWIKVLTKPGKDTILGTTIVGPHAGELITEFIIAMKHGLGLNKILSTTHIYPTYADAVKHTAGVWKKAHVPEKALKILAWFHRYRRKEKAS